MLQIVRTEGAYLFCSAGRAIFDAAAGAAVGNIGWGRPEIIDAMSAVARERTYVLPNLITEERLELVHKLREHWLPQGMERVFMTSSGSEAMDSAMRLARLYHHIRGEPSRWKMIGRNVSYHGTTLMTLAAGGHDDRRASFQPLLPSFGKV